MGMAMPYRDYGVASVEVGIFNAIAVPEGRIESAYRLDIPQFIYFEKVHRC